MDPRRRYINHNRDIKFVERILSMSPRERQIADQKRPALPKSPDILERIKVIEEAKKKEREEHEKEVERSQKNRKIKMGKELKGMDPSKFVINEKSVNVDDKIMNEIKGRFQSKEIDSGNRKSDDLEDTELDDSIIIAEILENIPLSENNSKFGKWKDIKKGEACVFIREATEEENREHEIEDGILVEFDFLVFKSSLNPDKNTNQHIISKSKLKLPDNFGLVTLEKLREVYQSTGQSLTHLGLLDYSDNFLNYIFALSFEDILFEFLEEIIKNNSPEEFNSAGFLKMVDRKPLLEPDDLDDLLTKFLNHDPDARTWFMSLSQGNSEETSEDGVAEENEDEE